MRFANLLFPFPGARSFKAATPAPLTGPWIRRQFRRTDDGSGGPLQTLRRAIKFWARCRWHAAPLKTSLSAFDQGHLAAVIDSEPMVPLRPLRSYLRRGLGATARAQSVQAHFGWVAAELSACTVEHLYRTGPIALLREAPPVAQLGLRLARAGGLGREGELALQLEWKGQPVMWMAFSILEAPLAMGGAAPEGPASLSGRRAVVGALQGARGAEAALHEVSAACQRLRPAALLVIALQALSQAWGLAAPLCVASRSHVYAGCKSRSRTVKLDYDAAWQSSGGEAAGPHYWLLPAEPALRPETEVESRKRAQHRRRNALRADFFVGVREGAEALLRRPEGRA